MNNTSMNFTSFTESILKQLREELGSSYTVFSKIVNKNNGVRRTGIIIRKEGQNTFPTVYIDGFFREGMTQGEMEELSLSILQELHRAELTQEVDLSDFIAFDRAGRKLAFKLVNAEKNRELLRRVPHKMFHDLALLYYYTVQEPPFCGNAVILVDNQHMRQWETNPRELYQRACANTPVLFPSEIDSMQEVMKGMLAQELARERKESAAAGKEAAESPYEKDWMDDLIEQMAAQFLVEKIPMYVLTNRQKLNGAACMLYPGVLKQFAGKVGRDLYILPSSVHEVILVPVEDQIDQEALRDIVTDINRTQVAADEVLSDSIYRFSREKDRILRLL